MDQKEENLMRDKIIIEGLRLYAMIGIHEWERLQPQEIIVNLELTANLAKAGVSDNINDSIDYGIVTEMVKELIAQSRFGLLEKLATEIINLIFTRFNNIESVTVKLSKPKALINAKSATVIMTHSLNLH